MKLRARRGRRIIKHRRLGLQVIAVCPVTWARGFAVLYWEPARYGSKPRGVK